MPDMLLRSPAAPVAGPVFEGTAAAIARLDQGLVMHALQ